ncbi:MAG TPA: threonine ammonia-lyase [Candidatus Polarisedimenticolia bacterium]|jgi:threonine dehydratase
MSRSGRVKGAPTFAQIEDARKVLAPLITSTPMLGAPAFSHLSGRRVWLKAENLQLTGSFKIRGAYNRISRLGTKRGVIAASAGNHAQGVALAATRIGLPSTIVMPVETPLIKVDRTKGHGAEVILHGSSFEDAFQKACEVGKRRGLTFIHAYEDRDVMAGQGTIGIEMLEACPDLEAVVVPVGGGGLISGIALAVKSLNPRVVVIGVQARNADPSVRSFHGDKTKGSGDTIADAIRFKKSSAVTMPILRGWVDEMVSVTEEEISEAIVRLLEESKIVAEGAGAVGVAALLAGRLPKRPRSLCILVSGGNIDLNMAARVIEQGLSKSNRYLVLRAQIPDKPGHLFGLLEHLAERRINLLDVQHRRAGWRIPLGKVEVEMLVETRNAGHALEIIESLEGAGYRLERAERG